MVRIQLMRADTLQRQSDSLLLISARRIILKDSTIMIQQHKLSIKDSMLVEKNNTIKLLSKLPKSQYNKIILPLIIVSAAEFFLLILAIK